MAFNQIQPSWQVVPCPKWCVEPHQEGDHADDQRHSSHGYVPVVGVRKQRDAEDHLTFEFEPTELMVILEMADGDGSEPWISIWPTEIPGPDIRVTAESAARVTAAINQLVDELQPGRGPDGEIGDSYLQTRD